MKNVITSTTTIRVTLRRVRSACNTQDHYYDRIKYKLKDSFPNVIENLLRTGIELLQYLFIAFFQNPQTNRRLYLYEQVQRAIGSAATRKHTIVGKIM